MKEQEQRVNVLTSDNMPTNISKSSITKSILTKTFGYFVLLLENGSYLLQESTRLIILENQTPNSGTNITKSSITKSNVAKS